MSTAGTVGASFGSMITGIVLDHATPNTSLMMPWIFVLCSIPFALLGWFIVRNVGDRRLFDGRIVSWERTGFGPFPFHICAEMTGPCACPNRISWFGSKRFFRFIRRIHTWDYLESAAAL